MGGRDPREPIAPDRTPAARTLSRVLSIGGGRFSTGRPGADLSPAACIFSRNWRWGAGEVAPPQSAALKPGPVFDRLRGNLPTGPGGPQRWAGRVAPFCGRLKRRKGENEARSSPKGASSGARVREFTLARPFALGPALYALSSTGEAPAASPSRTRCVGPQQVEEDSLRAEVERTGAT